MFNEADTRAKLIDPAIYRRGWNEDHIRREETAGGIDLIGDNKARRQRSGKVDYVLRVSVTGGKQPVALAVLEAKKESLMPGHGLEQAKCYAKCERLNVQFVISSNGHMFVLFDRHTGMTTVAMPMSDFPGPDELRTRYESAQGFSLNDEAAKPLLQPYATGEGTRRYYQDAAIRAVFEKMARCEKTGEPKRALLSLATGAGKTFIAVNLLKRLSDSGQMTRALFLCDRDELRTQALGAFNNAFGADAAEVYKKGDTNNAKNARIHIATYQTLGVDTDEGDASFLTTFYPENHFSHIVIDECHRSAWGKWSKVLERNAKAAQIGLTATPRELTVEAHTKEAEADKAITANNLKYFGEPVYEYSYTQAVEDGYLAACEIKKGRVSIDERGLTVEEIMAREPRDARTGELLTTADVQEHYASTAYENSLMLPDRVAAMCQDLFNYLLESGSPEQKTIIFCARDAHADAVAVKLNNLYAAWCTANGAERLDMYAFKCTAASSGNDQLPDLRASTRSHFIATTVDLLTTGVDVPIIRNIVFFKYLKSPISFYQMVGRGTRLHPESQKLMFRLYDYTNATRLFGEEFITKPKKEGEGSEGGGEGEPPRIITVDGFDVHVSPAGHFIVAEVDGQAKPIPVEEYRQRLATRLLQEAHSLEEFRQQWVDPPTREELMHLLVSSGCSPAVVQLVDAMEAYDLYDVLAQLGWGALPRTREDRVGAFRYKHEDWLHTLPEKTRAALLAIAGQFKVEGTEGLENPQIFQTPAVRNAGGLQALQLAGEPAVLFEETKKRMFAA
ncbi:MAG: DEAD/DEAH box helicase family protein [Flavobacteriales bacterium]|nr:DEAD/DEAH box helicase family protein [Flavobacteriales bacterium]